MAEMLCLNKTNFIIQNYCQGFRECHNQRFRARYTSYIRNARHEGVKADYQLDRKFPSPMLILKDWKALIRGVFFK